MLNCSTRHIVEAIVKHWKTELCIKLKAVSLLYIKDRNYSEAKPGWTWLIRGWETTRRYCIGWVRKASWNLIELLSVKADITIVWLSSRQLFMFHCIWLTLQSDFSCLYSRHHPARFFCLLLSEYLGARWTTEEFLY